MPAGTVERLPRERSAFALEGYALIEGFIPGDVLGALRREVDIALEAPPVAGCERPHNRLAPLRWNDPVVDLVLRAEERRRAVARVTGGEDLRWVSGYVSVKDPATSPLWWHQDWWCWDHPVSLRRAAAQVAVLVYLGDTDERSGALRVLPRSHHASQPLHATLRDLPAHDADLPLAHAALLDQPGQVTIRARAGDAVVVDYRLLHGTHPNDSPDRRDCLLLSFAPSWRGLPRDVRAHLIQHLAQPAEAECPATVGSWMSEALPSFSGVRSDLELSCVAPAEFAVEG